MNRYRDDARNVGTGAPVEVVPGIFEVRESLSPSFDVPDCWLSLYLLVDPTHQAPPVLVDSGWPRTAGTVVVPALAALGYGPEALMAVVNTHNHGDHTLGNGRLRAATGCEAWIGDADADGLDREATFDGEVIPPDRPDRRLVDGEELDLAGRTWEVVALPGHSPGSIGLWDPAARILVCGDALQAQATAVQGIAILPDRAAYAATLDRVTALAPVHLLPAHPYAPFTTCHVAGEAEVARYLDACRDHLAGYPAEVGAALRALGGGATTAALADRVCRDRGHDGTCPLAPRLLEADRAFLEGAGIVRAGDPAGHWHAA